MAIPKEAVDICKKWEGYLRKLPDGRAAPYLCPARVATLGWGTTFYPNGKKVTMQDTPITPEFAFECLMHEIEKKCAPTVDRVIKVSIHPLMRAACLSLAYNIGAGAFAKSTLVRRINERDWAACPAAFKMYRIGGGRVLTGLVNRRADEAALFMRGVAKLGETTQPLRINTPTATASAGGSWWAQVLRGILDGLRPKSNPVPA